MWYFCLEILYFSKKQILPYSGNKNQEVFAAKDLVFCHGEAQKKSLPNNFLLLVALRSNNRGHHNDLSILPVQLVPEAVQ